MTNRRFVGVCLWIASTLTILVIPGVQSDSHWLLGGVHGFAVAMFVLPNLRLPRWSRPNDPR